MKLNTSILKMSLAVAFTASLFTSNVFASEAQWDYQGNHDPKHWEGTCQSGVNQSPINISDGIEAKLGKIDFDYLMQSGQSLVNNGHSVQVNFASDQTIKVNNREFKLQQFHFHTPSENLIEGHSFPLEAHLVHTDADGNLAVVALMFEVGDENKELAKFWSLIPTVGKKVALTDKIDMNDLLPKDKSYYRFNGSLTTPPCTEGVEWFVFKKPVTLSQEQLDHFQEFYKGNNRPVQGTHGRPVLK